MEYQSHIYNVGLRVVREVLKLYPQLRGNLYTDFARRCEVVHIIMKRVPRGSRIGDFGAAPFVLSAMLKILGYEVVAIDIEPEPFQEIAKLFSIKVIKANLECDHLNLPDGYFDAIVLSEVLEHLNPYYIGFTLSEVNRVLKDKGLLILTTPNIASLFRRIKLLLGIQPIYRYHVREYTKKEVEKLLEAFGFEIISSGYSEVYDRTLLKPSSVHDLEKLAKIRNYFDMFKFVSKNLNQHNILKLIAYPIVKTLPSLRQTIIVIARKAKNVPPPSAITRWG